jgi:hypothetical protein
MKCIEECNSTTPTTPDSIPREWEPSLSVLVRHRIHSPAIQLRNASISQIRGVCSKVMLFLRVPCFGVIEFLEIDLDAVFVAVLLVKVSFFGGKRKVGL